MGRLTSRDKAVAIARAAEAKKAADVVILDMQGLTLIADYFVICHGQNPIHVRAIADGVEEEVREQGWAPSHREGYDSARWVLLDFDDVVQRSMTVVRDGELTWTPPPVAVSAAPAAPPAQEPVQEREPERKANPLPRRLGVAAAAAATFGLIAASPAALQVHLTVFALAIVIGYYVIGNVHHALHTPLMSVTNAISGIIVVGAILQIGQGDAAITALAFVAMLLASINVFGGFAVTRRMLAMFSRS